MNDRIRDRFFNEAFSTLFEDGKIKDLTSSGFSSSSNHYNFSIQSNEYFNLTDDFEFKGNEISHFTSLRGLFAILNSESIRLYNLNNLNDPTEYSYALPNEYKEKLERKKSGIYILSACPYDEMSLSEKFNMWKSYGESGFGARLILEYEQGTKFDINSSFLKRVQYKKYNLERFIQAKKRIEIEENIPPIKFLDTIKTPCILHKNNQYEMEKEIRLVYLNEYDDDALHICSNPETPYFLEYSYTANRICKYYNLKLNDPNDFAKIRIKKIELGSKHSAKGEIVDKLRWMCFSKQTRLTNTGVVVSDFDVATY